MARQYSALAILSRSISRAPVRQIINGSLRPAVVGAVTAQRSMGLVGSFTRGFTASGLRADASETALADMIAKELSTEKKAYEAPEEIKDGPPKPFKASEVDGSAEVVLTREFENETITITFVVNDEEQHEMPSDMMKEDDEEEEDEDFKDTIFFTVDVSKPDSDTLTFDCVTNGTDIDITGVLLDAADIEDTAAYTGPPDFSVLDEALLEKFEKYLDARGVNEDLASYILDVTSDKEQREYMGWLSKVEKFLKA